jgi:hypothetical protein
MHNGTSADYVGGSTNPQYYLEKHCDYSAPSSSSSSSLYYSVEEMAWYTFSILTTSLVVPCVRDQSSYFSQVVPSSVQPSLPSLSALCNKYVPLFTIVGQICSLVLAIVGYYEQYPSSSSSSSSGSAFACFGMYTLAMPYSIGILVPLTSFFVKANKGKVPHMSYGRLVLKTLLPWATALMGLPGLSELLSLVYNSVKHCFSCCQWCCTSCGSCALPSWDEIDFKTLATQLYSSLPVVWGAVCGIYICVASVLYIGSALLSVLSACALTACIAFISYLGAVTLPKLTLSWKQGLKMWLKDAAAEALSIKEQEFDLAQSLYVYGPMVYGFLLVAGLQLCSGAFFGEL